MYYLGHHSCEVLYTDYEGHAIELAKKYSLEGVDLIFSIGGDGTFNEVINGIILSSKINTPVCLIPNGTGNDFCRAQNFCFDKERILTALKYRTYLFYDVGKVSQNNKVRYFLNVMDIGFGGLATHILDQQRRKGLTGGLSYSIAILRTFFTFKKPNVSLILDHKEVYSGKMMMVAIANSSTFGNGLVIFPGAKANDGKLGLTVLGDVTFWDYLINLRNLKRGTKIKHKSMMYSEGKSIHIRINKGYAPIEMDGEVFGDGDCDIEILPGVIKVLKY